MTEDLNIYVFDMITGEYESKNLRKDANVNVYLIKK